MIQCIESLCAVGKHDHIITARRRVPHILNSVSTTRGSCLLGPHRHRYLVSRQRRRGAIPSIRPSAMTDFRTPSDPTAALWFPDGSIVIMAENTMLRVSRLLTMVHISDSILLLDIDILCSRVKSRLSFPISGHRTVGADLIT